MSAAGCVYSVQCAVCSVQCGCLATGCGWWQACGRVGGLAVFRNVLCSRVPHGCACAQACWAQPAHGGDAPAVLRPALGCEGVAGVRVGDGMRVKGTVGLPASLPLFSLVTPATF